ncbi:hypothetical protein S100141_00337 [Bacillus licheniformis]|nr:hypothetical protein S100141_00337 [Bacillus licheniformis]
MKTENALKLIFAISWERYQDQKEQEKKSDLQKAA